MIKLNKTQKNATILILLNIFLLAGYLVVSGEISNNNNQISSLTEELDRSLIKGKNLNLSRRITEETAIERDKLDSYFISSNDVVSFIKEIENLANLADVSIEINSVSIGDYVEEQKKSDVIEVLDLDINLSGSWSGSFHFISLLEEMPNKISVERLNLSAKESSNNKTTKWDGAIGLKILKLK
jgi:hypothetical protein